MLFGFDCFGQTNQFAIRHFIQSIDNLPILFAGRFHLLIGLSLHSPNMTRSFHLGSIVAQTILRQLNQSQSTIDANEMLEFELAHVNVLSVRITIAVIDMRLMGMTGISAPTWQSSIPQPRRNSTITIGFEDKYLLAFGCLSPGFDPMNYPRLETSLAEVIDCIPTCSDILTPCPNFGISLTTRTSGLLERSNPKIDGFHCDIWETIIPNTPNRKRDI